MRNIVDWFRGGRVPGTEPFPTEWASFLRDHSAQYRRLSGRLKAAFEQDVQRFLGRYFGQRPATWEARLRATGVARNG